MAHGGERLGARRHAGGQEVARVAPDHLLPLIAVDGAERVVGLDHPLAVVDRHALARRGRERPEPLLGLARGRGTVAHRDAARGPVGVEPDLDADPERREPAEQLVERDQAVLAAQHLGEGRLVGPAQARGLGLGQRPPADGLGHGRDQRGLRPRGGPRSTGLAQAGRGGLLVHADRPPAHPAQVRGAAAQNMELSPSRVKRPGPVPTDRRLTDPADRAGA